jgi:chemotaxis protein MotB
LLAAQLGKLPNRLSVEGHTDANPYVSAAGYSNWELSSDRANSARKFIQQFGVRSDQVADVRGYADQKLRKPEDPTSASNRRVSIVVKYKTADDPPAPAPDGKPSPAGQAKPAVASSPTPGKPPAAPASPTPAKASPPPLSTKPENSSPAPISAKK